MPRAYYPPQKPPVAKPVPQPVSGLNLTGFIGRKELAAKFSVHIATVGRAVERGLITPTWFCGKQLFSPAEVERFVAAQTRPRKEG